jgi:glutaredoxin
MINIYYLEYCPHSLQALETLKKYKIEYIKIESSNNKDKRKQFYPTFPQIYWNNNLLGGNSDLTNIINTLQTKEEPIIINKWPKKEWYAFLINIAQKLQKKEQDY